MEIVFGRAMLPVCLRWLVAKVNSLISGLRLHGYASFYSHFRIITVPEAAFALFHPFIMHREGQGGDSALITRIMNHHRGEASVRSIREIVSFRRITRLEI